MDIIDRTAGDLAGCPSCLAAQPVMGLRTERNAWNGSDHSFDPGAAWQNLNVGNFARIRALI